MLTKEQQEAWEWKLTSRYASDHIVMPSTIDRKYAMMNVRVGEVLGEVRIYSAWKALNITQTAEFLVDNAGKYDIIEIVTATDFS